MRATEIDPRLGLCSIVQPRNVRYSSARNPKTNMAHIIELAESLATKPNHAQGVKVGVDSKFPATEVFTGFNRPSCIEGDDHDLEVTGKIPDDIDGTFFRIQPDHRFAPTYESDVHFNGDGNVTAIRLSNGRAHFKQRYVHTDRYHHEAKHGKSTLGPAIRVFLCFVRSDSETCSQ